ncbi:MAG: Na-translocating system protein MpsC family protein [Planctomycetota bacterium]|jgi:uncharacterized protein YbcI
MKTKGRIEATISEAFTKFERDYTGRGPSDVRTYLVDDMVVVRLKGLLAPAEKHLLTEDPVPEEREVVKRFRGALIEKARPVLEPVITAATGRRIVSLYSDISTRMDERIVVLTLDGPVQLAKQK